MTSRLFAGSALLVLALPGAALAQQQPGEPASAEQAPPETPGGLEEIVVTAQRRAESLQRAAIPVSAVGSEALVAASVTETSSLTKLVPALVVQPSGGSGVNLYIRGVGTLQGNAYAENPIAFNFNGVYIARPTAPVGSFYDIDRLEVVKGPQGTLYGRNATGGAINVLPARPKLGDVSGNVILEYGNYDSKKASAALNVPLGDRFALRVAGQVVDRDGYLSDGYDDEVGQALRGSLLFDTGGGWSALLVADWFHQGGQGIGSVLARTPGVAAPAFKDRIGAADPRAGAALAAFGNALPAPPFCPGGFIASGCVIAPQRDGFNDSTFWGTSLTVEGDLGFATLTVLPAYRSSRPRYRFYLTGFRGDLREVDDQLSLEVRLASQGDGPLSYVVGGYYFVEDQVASNYFFQGELSTTRFAPRLETESKAVFGQATLGLNDSFRLVAGARYTDESKTQRTGLAVGGRPGVVEPPLGAPFFGDLDFSKLTWKAGIEWDAGPASLVYGSVSTGFKAGGFFTAAPPNNSFRPETITAYSLGAKNRFLDNRLQLNLEAFYWDYTDQQISFVGGVQTGTGIGSGLITVNAGTARMYGGEAELRFAITPEGRLGINVQYLNGKYTSLAYTALSASGGALRSGCTISNSRLANPGTPSPARLFDVNCSGKPTVNSPEWTANISYDHTFELGNGLELVAGARTRLESGRDVTIDYVPELRQGSYMLSDASLTLNGGNGRWSIAAFVNNIENEAVLGGGTLRPILQNSFAILRPPRTYGGRVTFNF